MTQETSGARRLNKVFILFSFCIFAGAFFVFIGESPKHVFAALAAPVTSPYLYNFNADGTLEETWPVDQSTSPYWWVNSGAYLKMLGGTGHTNEGTLPLTDRWRVIYAANNPTDTDNGAHPQNIFRLVTRNTWQNAQEEAYFKITADNLSASPNRNASNGILFFNRYQDGNNLYYTGIRVDGEG